MILEALKSARDIPRLHEIASILVRHGFGDAIRRIGVAKLLKSVGRALHWQAAANLQTKPTHQHVREALEDLGPTFVKFGQILAGRTDLLPAEWTEELSQLHENVPQIPYAEIESQLSEDLGHPPAELFQHLDPTPLAAGSIAQVHRAELMDGHGVVLKVRRPGIEEVVEADLRLLIRLAQIAEKEIDELKRFRPHNMAQQFARSLRNELDMRVEARNAQRLARNMRNEAGIVIPRIHTRWTCERLCVMDHLPGESLGSWIRKGQFDTVDPRQIAANGAHAVLKMIFEDGFFHADPHPGNVFILPDGKLGLLDFGMVGRLSEQRRIEFLGILIAVVRRDVNGVVDTLMQWSSDPDLDINVLEQDCSDFIDRYDNLSLRELDATGILVDVAQLCRNNNLFLPNDIALLLKTFVTLDGLGRQLDPDFVMTAHIEPFARRALRSYQSAFAVTRRGLRDIRRLMFSMPGQVNRLLTNARRGRFTLGMELLHLKEFGHQLERSTNRLTMGVVTAALIVGTAIVLAGPGEASIFGLLGFLASMLAGFWLLWSVLRSGKG